MMELKGFITNLGKYNEGELIGKWIDFPIDEDDLNEALKEIGCAYEDEDGEIINGEYEEYFFTDWECEIDLELGEYPQIDYINEIAEKINAFSEYELDTFKAACKVWFVDEVLNGDIDDYVLYTDVYDEYDLGYYWVNDSGCYNLQDVGNLANYIDYEAFGRDISLETNGGFTSYGWIEHRG